jgi:hypothetical protein
VDLSVEVDQCVKAFERAHPEGGYGPHDGRWRGPPRDRDTVRRWQAEARRLLLLFCEVLCCAREDLPLPDYHELVKRLDGAVDCGGCVIEYEWVCGG